MKTPRAPAGDSYLLIISAYGLTHAAVDASCAAVIFAAAATDRLPAFLALTAVVLYNLLAFAIQPLIGWPVTDAAVGKRVALAGASATAAAILLVLLPGGLWPAIVVAGVGNAAFHVGGGVVALRLRPGKAGPPGLFVAPGAAGLAIGIALGNIVSLAWLPALVLALCIPVLALLPSGQSAPQRVEPTDETRFSRTAGLLLIVLAVIGLRSFVGSALALPWKAQPWLLVGLTTALVLGKAAGGVLADRYGRIVVGVGALVASLPLLLLAARAPAAGIAGTLLFNLTMPVTLVAVADILHERPGFAFGLTCLALIAGALPPLLGLTQPLSAATLALCVSASAALLWLGLRPEPTEPSRNVSALTEQEA